MCRTQPLQFIIIPYQTIIDINQWSTFTQYTDSISIFHDKRLFFQNIVGCPHILQRAICHIHGNATILHLKMLTSPFDNYFTQQVGIFFKFYCIQNILLYRHRCSHISQIADLNNRIFFCSFEHKVSFHICNRSDKCRRVLILYDNDICKC